MFELRRRSPLDIKNSFWRLIQALSFVSVFGFSFGLSLNKALAQSGNDLVKVHITPYQQDLIAIQLNHEKGWHTYWENSGDSGLATQFKWEIAGKESQNLISSLAWPIPETHVEGGEITTYGYEHSPIFFFKYDQGKLANQTVKLQVNWLVCKEICIPGSQKIDFKFSSNGFSTNSPSIRFPAKYSKIEVSNLDEAYSALPTSTEADPRFSFKLSLGETEKSLKLIYQLKGVKEEDWKNRNTHKNLLTPFKHTVLGHRAEVLKWDASSKTLIGQIPIDWDGDYVEPKVEFPKLGKLATPMTAKYLFHLPNTQGYKSTSKIIELKFDSVHAKNATFAVGGSTEDHASKNSGSGGHNLKTDGLMSTLAGILFLAFLGGFLLNLMPCVLPVISIKLFGLIKYQNKSRSELLKHNLFYMLGVHGAFLLMSSAIIILQSFGTELGWGFQLQSPTFVSIILVILLFLALSLYGVFELSTPGGKTLGKLKIPPGPAGDTLTGVFTTILSTPCLAPAMGPALAFAFQSSISLNLLIFQVIALGLSFPFLATGFFPGLLEFLPKPGSWMEGLRIIMGASILLTILWLVDVLIAQVPSHLVMFQLLPIFIFITTWMILRSQFKHWLIRIVMPLLILILTGNYFYEINLPQPAQTISANGNNLENRWSAWSPQAISEAKNSKQRVFVDFTAKWCLTCQVNKKLVMNTEDFTAFTQKHGIKLLRADWTQRDEVITRWLKERNIVGVPAYFVYDADGKEFALGETVTIGKIKEALKL